MAESRAMRPYTLVEPCCGMAALTLHQLGARRALLPYQGSKWRFRRELAALLAEVGAVGPPARVELHDAGPSRKALAMVLRADPRLDVIEAIDTLGRLNAAEVYDALHRHRAPRNDVAFAAQFLFLQRLAFSGKAVGIQGGQWVSAGFNMTSAYGTEATPRFGAVRPMVMGLLDVLRAYTFDVEIGAGVATDLVVTYIDPPYAQGTRYPCGHLPREGVVQMALHAGLRGPVIVSEAEPVAELVSRGWSARQLGAASNGESPFKSKSQEWVTVSPHFRQPTPYLLQRGSNGT